VKALVKRDVKDTGEKLVGRHRHIINLDLTSVPAHGSVRVQGIDTQNQTGSRGKGNLVNVITSHCL